MGWIFAEYAPVGVDLASPEAVADYDTNQGTDAARDRALLDRLGVGPGTRFLDLACGTGSLVREAARRGAHASGVDVSVEMLAHAERRAVDEGLTARWRHAGFLDHDAPGPDGPADVLTCRAALHQLPDFWKQAALLRVAAALRPGGRFFLSDVVFGFDSAEYADRIETWIGTASRPPGAGFTRADFETHVREEFSTYTWIMEGMLERAGLTVELRDSTDPIYAEFWCRR